MTIGIADKTLQAADKAKEEPRTPSSPGTGLGGAEGQAEKTYRQSEVDALLGKSGQKIKANLETVTAERDLLKSQLVTLTAEITEAKESIASLTKDIEAMSEDNPDKDALVKRRKEWEKALQGLKAEQVAIGETKKELTQWKRDQLVYTVADEFVTADGKAVDFDSFKAAADKFNLSEREGLVALAETMGLKEKTEALGTEGASEPLTPYSGATEGGASSSEEASLKKRYPTMFPKK